MASDHLLRALKYARSKYRPGRMKLLGWGDDGYAYQIHDEHTVVKVFSHPNNYQRESGCYLRLRAHSLTSIDGLVIPRLRGLSDELLAVEMDFVTPPCIIDFGKCYLDRGPDYSPEVIADEEEKLREMWGDEWPRVQSILWRLERIGIYYVDPNVNNIQFR